MKKRDQCVKLMLSKKEKKQLDMLSNRLGLSVSSCLRMLFLKEILLHTDLSQYPGLEIEFK